MSLTAFFAVTGTGFVCYPFLASLAPSEKALAGDLVVRIDVRNIPKGEARRFKWNGLPVIVLHRTKAQLEQLVALNDIRANHKLVTSVQDPQEVLPKYRSINPEYFVVYGWTGNAVQCGSSYTAILDNYPLINGGFSEMCRGAWHDVTGRLLKGSWLEGGDLPIPPYKFITNSTIELGRDRENILHKWRKQQQTHNTTLHPTKNRDVVFVG